MAMTKEEYQEALRKVGELAGGSDEVLEALAPLGAEYDEWSAKAAEGEKAKDKDGTYWRDKYTDMVDRYTKRFFGGAEEIQRATQEDIAKDDKVSDVTFDDLFAERQTKNEGII